MFVAKSVEVHVNLPSDLEIEFTCRFRRSARLLFDAWTKPEHIKNWWGCEGAGVTHCALDLRVGGRWSRTLRMADGSDHPFHGVYREIVRPSRLVYTECYNMPQFGNPEWLTTVTFDEEQGETLLTHTIRHKSRELRDAHLPAGMQEGEIQSLAHLDQVVAAME